jgi:flagellar motor switch protein FliM
VTAAAVTPISLFKENNEDAGHGDIDIIGERLSRNLQELLTASSGRLLTVKAGSVNAASYTEWRIAQNPYALLFRYRLTVQGAQLLVHVPGHLLSQIVDLAYGGIGNLAVRSAFAPAETRFAERIAETLLPAIRAAWKDTPTIGPTLSGIETDLLNANWPKAQDRILVSNLFVEGDGIKPATISWIISAETANTLPAAPGAESSVADPVWSQRMRASAMAVSLPVRSILTRCELPLSRLLTLTTGDIIPVFLPSSVPLTVAGRTFAHGSIGEANGRAALRIETMEKGFAL